MRAFISYSSKDRDFVSGLAEDLDLLDHTVWFDRELNQQGGHQWWALILEQIRACDVFIATISPHVLESEPCRREYRYAKALGKPVLPILLADVDIHRLPLDIQQQQILRYNQRSHDQLAALKESLRNLPPAPPLPDPLPEAPPTPLDTISEIMDRIDHLTSDPEQQKLLATDIYALKDDEKYVSQVPDLLRRLLKREDVLTARNLKLVEDFLSACASVPASTADKKRSTGVLDQVKAKFRSPKASQGPLSLRDLQDIFLFSEEDLKTNREKRLTAEQFDRLKNKRSSTGSDIGLLLVVVVVGLVGLVITFFGISSLSSLVKSALGFLSAAMIVISVGFFPRTLKKWRVYHSPQQAQRYIKAITGQFEYSSTGITKIDTQWLDITTLTRRTESGWSSYKGIYPGLYTAYVLKMPGENIYTYLLSIEPLDNK